SCPVETSSSTNTSQPCESRSSERCEPMNPAPPVMSALLLTRRSLLRTPDASKRAFDRVLAGLEAEGRAQLSPGGGRLLRPQVREPELEARVDRARLLPDGLLQRRDRLLRGGRKRCGDQVRLDAERIEAPRPAEVGSGRRGAVERVARERGR